ncbi:MAG TPA: hypothetical protein VMV72_18590 [Verrucomicrobiae bacterium]|nr:hypothetical protein [Verrucomicrobiae bacterium]
MPNNVAEIILRVTTEGTQNAQALADNLTQIDQASRQVNASALSAASAQRVYTLEVVNTHSQMARLLQDWSDLGGQVDHFAAATLRNFSSTSAHALTEWIEGSHNAREAFRELANEVIEGIIRMMIQQVIAHTLGSALNEAAAAQATATNAEITASAAPAAAMQGAASYGANSSGVGVVLAVVAAAIAMLLAMRRAEGGPIYGAGSTTSDSIPAWLSNREYVHPAAAHDYYGTAAMDAIRTRSIPREAIHAAMSRRRFAVGGPVMSFPSWEGIQGVGRDSSPLAVNVGSPNVMLAIGDAEIERLVASSAMQKALFDHSAKNAVRTSRLVTRNSSHRGEQ